MKKPYKTETTHVHKLACFSCEHVRVYPHKKKKKMERKVSLAVFVLFVFNTFEFTYAQHSANKSGKSS